MGKPEPGPSREDLPRVTKKPSRGPFGIGGCCSKGHMQADGAVDHLEVYEIEFSAISVRACEACARAIVDQLREYGIRGKSPR